MAAIEVYLLSPNGTRLRLLPQFLDLELNLTTNGVSVAALGLDGVQYDIGDFGKNYRLEIWRGGQLQGGAPFLIRKKKLSLSGEGEWRIQLTGLHANTMLSWRKVAYYAGSPQATATTEAADDLLKRLVRENLGSLAQNGPHITGVADGLRDEPAPDLSGYLTVAADESKAPNTSRGFSREKMLDLMGRISLDSYEQGSPLFFGFEKNNAGLLEFRTRTRQWGSNRTSQFVVSPDFLNFVNVSKEWDWSNEATVVYALGQNQAESREVAVAKVSDTGGLNGGLNWVEATIDGRNADSSQLPAEAKSTLKEYQAKITLNGELQETDSFRYGVDWQWGDRVLVEFGGERAEAWLNKVVLNVRDGRETIRAIPEIVQ